ncbi:MAG: riboflavin synthase [Bacteroidota bacterium]
MFTGIVEITGKVIALKKEKSNITFIIETAFIRELKKGQSVSHNGVCLTIEKISSSRKSYYVTAVKETLDKSNLGLLSKGSIVNLERSLKVGDRLDGHFVQGHVDCIAHVQSIKEENGSWLFGFEISGNKIQNANLIVEKGSISINGVSLTIVDVRSSAKKNKKVISFSIAIIPHTFSNTNFGTMKKGDAVNLEFDVLGKYIQKIISSQLA